MVQCVAVCVAKYATYCSVFDEALFSVWFSVMQCVVVCCPSALPASLPLSSAVCVAVCVAHPPFLSPSFLCVRVCFPPPLPPSLPKKTHARVRAYMLQTCMHASKYIYIQTDRDESCHMYELVTSFHTHRQSMPTITIRKRTRICNTYMSESRPLNECGMSHI